MRSLPCLRDACPKPHTVGEGHMTRMSAFYPKTMVVRVIHYLKQDSLGATGQVERKEPKRDKDMDQRGKDSYQPGGCNCRLFQDGGISQVCASCILGIHQGDVFVGDDLQDDQGDQADQGDQGDQGNQGADGNPAEPAEQPEDPAERREWERKFRLIHSATGHEDVKLLVDALKQKGADPKVVEWAKQFTCRICEERKKPGPRRVAHLEMIPKRWKVVLADCAVWRDPRTDKRLGIGLLMDQGCRFLVGKVLVESGIANVQADQYQQFFQDHWQVAV